MRRCEALRANADDVAIRTMIMIATSVRTSILTSPADFSARPSGAIKSITSSVIEKRISSTHWRQKSVRHGQRATLVGLQRNFLCQHDIPCDEVTFGRKAPTNTRTAGAVELVNVHRGAVAYPVSLSTMAAGDLKMPLRGILCELLRR